VTTLKYSFPGNAKICSLEALCNFRYRRNRDSRELTKYKQKWILLLEWKALETQNKSLAVDLPEDEDLQGRYKNYWTDILVRLKQVI
jgi:hypothetical protein